MARNRDPFTQALTTLRERIHSGVLASGSAVIVQDEAARLGLSTTPIREALARLSGEGLVERASSGGYVTTRLDATAARDHYAMQAYLLRLALELNSASSGRVKAPAPAEAAGRPDVAVTQLLAMNVRSAGNEVLWRSFLQVNSQLDRLRRMEARLFTDLSDECQALYEAYRRTEPEAFDDAIRLYHQRRRSAAGALVALFELHHSEGGSVG